MGKGQKGKGRGDQKPNSKFKQRSAQNKKQLAKVERILQQGRSKSRGDKGDRQKKLDNRKGEYDNKRRGGQSHQRRGNSRSYEREENNRPQERRGNSRSQQSHERGNSRSQQRGQWQDQKGSKTKQISKQFSNDRQGKRRHQQDQQQENGPIKGNPLFKIIPESMNGDEFAALGGNSDEQNEEEMGDSEVSNESQEGEGHENDGEEEFEQEELNEQDGQEQYDDEMEEQGQEEQVEGQQEEQELDEDQFGQQGAQGEQGEEFEQEGQQQQGQQEGQENAEEQQQEQGAEDEQQKQKVDISVVSLKIQQTIQILMNVAKLGGGKSRKHFLEELKNLIHQYYGYNFELISHFLDFLNPAELIQFFEANETQRPLTIRTNTLKTRRKELAQSLIQRGVNLDPLAEWSNVGIKIYETKVPIGATPEYLAGHYMLQSASSFLPVLALDPQPYQKVLDMASAPGGKTTYIAQLMKNTGSVFANDLKKQRLRALQFNLYRLGVTNTAVTCRDGRKFPSIFPSTFDRVLLDAPCTGLGIISKDPSIKATRVMMDIYKNAHLQRQLLLAAIDSCKVNGTIVYSTCSVSPLENEAVVNYALKRRFIKIVDCGIEVGEEGLIKFVQKRFHVDLKKTRRIYPHVHNMDGFYVAKLIKVAKGKKQIKEEDEKEDQQPGQQMVEELEQ